MDKKQLEHLLVFYKKEYYEGRSSVSDFLFDSLEEKLRSIDPDSPYFHMVGFDANINSSFEKVEHIRPMLSLDKTNTMADLKKWIEKQKSLSFVISYKIDGFAVSLIYEKTKDRTFVLSRASSRGGGLFGEDITFNVLTIEDIPKEIISDELNDFDEIEIRGEVYMKTSIFRDLVEKGKIPRDSNIRNIAAGSCRNKDTSITKERNLSFFAYYIYPATNNYFKDLQFLSSHFRTIPHILYDTKNELPDLTKRPSEIDYEIDGYVLRISDNEKFDLLGTTSHHPLGAIAFKFKSETATTILKKVEWQVSRSGRINPVAIFESVEVGGAVIERSSLFNITHIIDRLKLKENSILEIARNNDVIPYVVSSVGGNGNIEIPTKCPVCGESTYIMDDGEAEVLFCSNKFCEAVVKHTITHFCEAMDMMGISEQTISDFLKHRIISCEVDLYTIIQRQKIDDLLKLEGYQKKKVRNILDSIEKSRKTTLSKFIYSLGIEGIGKELGNSIAKYIESETKNFEFWFSSLIPEKLNSMKIEGFGDKKKNYFIIFVEENLKKICDLLKQLSFVEKDVSSVLKGKRYCITGSISIPREEFIRLVEENGGIFKSGVTKDLTYLVVGKDPGSKLEKARESGVILIDEATFFEKIGKSINIKTESKDDFELF